MTHAFTRYSWRWSPRPRSKTNSGTTTRGRRREDERRSEDAEPGEDPGRLLDQSERGGGRLDRRRERRRPAAARGLRRGAESGREPGAERRPRRADRGLLQTRLRPAAGMDLAVRRVDGRQRRRADRDRREHQYA